MAALSRRFLSIFPLMVVGLEAFSSLLLKHQILSHQCHVRHGRSNGQLARLSASFDTSIIDPTGITIGFALVSIGVLSQQSSLMNGKSGLGAFLQDGKGYKNSAYQPNDNLEKKDPLPWLKLPKFDFVEVYGAKDDDGLSGGVLSIEDELAVRARLDSLSQEFNSSLNSGNLQKAQIIRIELENLLVDTGFQYEYDE